MKLTMAVVSTYLAVTFVCALVAVAVRLPPLVGFLAAGFVLAALDMPELPGLQTAADLGVTLLLFGIGLRLDLRILLRKEVWATAAAHIVVFTLLGAGLLKLMMLLGAPLLGDEGWQALLLLGFALSFSSTVLVVKLLDERGESQALYGRVAIGVLVIQDIAAVAFITVSKQDLPNPWAVVLVLLWPLTLALRWIWTRIGHGEMQAIFGVVAAFLPGYVLFESVGIKGDLGALVMGILLASHRKSTELSRALFTVKELLLVAFFLSIGLTGVPHVEHLVVAVVLVVLVPVQGVGYSLLLSAFGFRRRTTSRAGIALATFSEFGLIVAAVSDEVGWLASEWQTVLAVSVAISFAISSAAARSETLADRYAAKLPPDPPPERLHPECRPVDLGDAQTVVLGMGRVGQGAARQLVTVHRLRVVGVEQSTSKLGILRRDIRVIEGDAADILLWESIIAHPDVRLVVIALPSQETTLDVIARARAAGYSGVLAAVARYPDHDIQLRRAGAAVVLQVYAGAGAQLADEAVEVSG